jgi:hypothetical protein
LFKNFLILYNVLKTFLIIIIEVNMQAISKISNIQYELLKLFANNVPEKDLLEVKKILVSYFSKKLDDSFDDFYKSNNLSPDDLKKWATEHNRVSTR